MCASRHLLGVVAEHEGDLALARAIYEECLPIWKELRFPVQVAWTTHGLGFVAYRQGDFPAARSLLIESLRLFREMEYMGGLVLTVERLGGLAAAQGQMQRAARLLAAGANQRAATGAQAALATQQEFERDVAAVRAGLEEEAFAAAWAVGQAMTMQEVMEYALQDEEEGETVERPEAQGVIVSPHERIEPHATSGAPALTVLATKLALPVLSSSLLPRPRLTARLDGGGSRAHLALLVAPPGSGKSSLVGQWCQQQEEGSVAWLSLDPEDSHPTRFLLDLCAALETVAPAAAQPARAQLQAAGRPSLEHVLTVLVNGLTSHQRSVTLVLDDYHEIEATAVPDLVTFLVEHLPPTLFLIIATRCDPPLPLSRLRLRGQVIELRAEDLRFTHAEAAQFLNERMGLALPPATVDRLAERTEGWAAGLQMAALSLQGEADAAGFLDAFAGSDRVLVDYLSEEVLRRQAPDVLAFLGQTAFLKRLCAPLCEAVTGTPGGQAMLEQLEAANLFLIPLDRERRWYRYQHLFAAVLRARLLPKQGEQLAALYERAAAWYEAEGMVEEAIEHALAGGQFDRAGDLLEGQYESMWRQGEWRALERWLRALPSGLIRTRPHLSIALAGVHNYYFRVAEADQVLNHCGYEPREDTPETRDLTGRLLVVRSQTARLRGDREQAVALSRQALELLPPESHHLRSSALLHLGMLHEASGDLVAAGRAFADAILEAQHAGYSLVRLRASYGHGYLRETEGALNEAACVYQEAMEYAGKGNILHTPAAALIYAALGRLCYLRNDLANAATYLQEGLKHADVEFAETPLYAVPAYFELLRIESAPGEPCGAATFFEQLAERQEATKEPLFEPLFALLRVRRREATAAITAAWLNEFEARTADGRLPSAPIPDFRLPDIRSLEIATWARLRLAQGQTAAVVARLERFLSALAEQRRHSSALEVRVLLATLHWDAGRREQAVAVLEPALVLAAREGYVRVFLEAGPGLIPVLRQAAAQGIVLETVGKLLAALGTGAAGPPRGPGARSVDPPAKRVDSPETRSREGSGPEVSRRSSDEPQVQTDSPALIEPLSDRELEVLRLVAAGLRAAEIAAQLFVSEGTVRRHLHNLYGKLGVTSVTSAVARGRALGLL
jgi:LuxR family maltose regulon positive regulatory protein